jgi:hypothetical protein
MTDQLVEFFTIDPEPPNLLIFSNDTSETHKLGGFSDVSGNARLDSSGCTVTLNTILKEGQILRIRPDTYYYKEYRGIYTCDGKVNYNNVSLSLLDFLKEVRKEHKQLYGNDFTSSIPQTRTNTNPLRYIEVYDNNMWVFIIKLLNPSATIPEYATEYDLFYSDILNIWLNNIGGSITIFEAKYNAIKEMWDRSVKLNYILVKKYNKKLHDMYYNEAPPTTTINPLHVNYVNRLLA